MAAAAPVILWYRNDLRLADHPALTAVLETGHPVLPIFLHDPDAPEAPGGAARWWLHHALAALTGALAATGAPLILRRGPVIPTLAALARAVGAVAVHAGQGITPQARAEDLAAAAALGEAGIAFRRFRTHSLLPPDAPRTGAGTGFSVYTPFARAAAALAAQLRPPAPAPARIPAPSLLPASDALASWRLLPRAPDWAQGLRDSWTPGEAGAEARFAAFRDTALAAYAARRDRPDLAATSRLSPHLHFGEISLSRLWHAIPPDHPGADKFRAELLWREFSLHLLWHHPLLPERPLRAEFAAFPWRHDPAALTAWQQGRTGIPLVDAGMRELWHTGWMHNRVRMVAASFLVKHLLIPWQAGAAWFRDTLVDADLAANSASWQWVAGCGADAAPYFRIFNPVLQGRKFDPTGAYIRHHVRELATVADAHIHAPWEAARPPASYPPPIIDLAAGRARALAAFATLKP
jgi:deoxyribodipyrimidine photo-lyase